MSDRTLYREATADETQSPKLMDRLWVVKVDHDYEAAAKQWSMNKHPVKASVEDAWEVSDE